MEPRSCSLALYSSTVMPLIILPPFLQVAHGAFVDNLPGVLVNVRGYLPMVLTSVWIADNHILPPQENNPPLVVGPPQAGYTLLRQPH